MSKKWFWILLFPAFFHLFQLFFLHYDGKFKPNKFAHGFAPSYSTEVQGLDFQKLECVLDQPFHYLGAGKQMIAFESQDKKYVLKFFNPMRPLKKGWVKKWKYWQRYSSLKWISREWLQRKARLKKLFTRHKWAYELLKEETGLVFVHLSPSERVAQKLFVTDLEGNNHRVDLAKTPFILQEKATLVPRFLSECLQNNQLERAQTCVRRLEVLFQKRLSVGISDRIQTMNNNYGFVGDKPIQIDVGRIRMYPELKTHPEQEQKRIFDNLHAWIAQEFPNLTTHPQADF